MLVLSVLVTLGALMATAVQLAVLRDRTIEEPDSVHIVRRLRVATWFAVGLYTGWHALNGWIIAPGPVLLALAALELTDTLSALRRLFPDTDRQPLRCPPTITPRP